MKNKEIEELLKELKEDVKYYKNDYDYKNSVAFFNVGKIELLLSYIEQLENRNKELYEGFMATQEELTDYAVKNEQLENNRDKAINHIDLFISDTNLSKYDTLKILMYTKKILKGDSDE